MDYLEFIETPVFSRQRVELLNDEGFQQLQEYLLENYSNGDIISKTGGCRKIRWNRQGMGKQGGVRVIYYVIASSGRLYFLLMYPKNKKDDLTESEKMILNKLCKQLD